VKKAIVTDSQLMQAIAFDGHSSAELRACLERALIAEGKLKRFKAQVMKTFSDPPVTAQEGEAYASEAYAAAMDEEAKAAAALEEIKERESPCSADDRYLAGARSLPPGRVNLPVAS
jgi:hypothetical protein